MSRRIPSNRQNVRPFSTNYPPNSRPQNSPGLRQTSNFYPSNSQPQNMHNVRQTSNNYPQNPSPQHDFDQNSPPTFNFRPNPQPRMHRTQNSQIHEPRYPFNFALNNNNSPPNSAAPMGSSHDQDDIEDEDFSFDTYPGPTTNDTSSYVNNQQPPTATYQAHTSNTSTPSASNHSPFTNSSTSDYHVSPPNPFSPTPPVVIGKKRYSDVEDVLLCSAWLNTSKDAATGKEQGNSTFWGEIAKYYNMYRDQNNQQARNQQALASHWSKMSGKINKFQGHYERILYRKESGLNDVDRRLRAKKLYQDIEGKEFKHIEAWEKLYGEEKWKSLCIELNKSDERSAKRSKSSSSNQHVPSPTHEDNLPHEDTDTSFNPRPIGRKAAKAKNKQKVGTTDSSDSISEALNQLVTLDNNKIDAFREYTATMEGHLQLQKEREQKKEERERKKDEREKRKEEREMKKEEREKRKEEQNRYEIMLKIVQTDESKLTPSQKKIFETLQAKMLQSENSENQHNSESG